MNIERVWEDFSSSEKDAFQRSIRKLLKQTFIVRDRDEENKRLYYFISKRSEAVEHYLSFIGFGIIVDRDNGVVVLRNCADLGENGKIQENHVTLKKIESIVLCTLWTLYAERLRTGILSQSILINMTDLRFALEKYGMKDMIDKSAMTSILRLFSRYNLINVVGKVGDPDCMIELYASLQFAMDEKEFQKFVENTEKRMFTGNEEIAEEAEMNSWMEETEEAEDDRE